LNVSIDYDMGNQRLFVPYILGGEGTAEPRMRSVFSFIFNEIITNTFKYQYDSLFNRTKVQAQGISFKLSIKYYEDQYEFAMSFGPSVSDYRENNIVLLGKETGCVGLKTLDLMSRFIGARFETQQLVSLDGSGDNPSVELPFFSLDAAGSSVWRLKGVQPHGFRLEYTGV
ncbi:MAG: hypothetical protein KAV87_22155, partial [Desulfobacteraceae bacterium]|nr:hypothetical protein [Desulfobacteraceae bacterium]